MDIYEDQEWKTAPGVPGLLLWCLQHLEVKEKHLFCIRCCTADMRLPMKRGDYDHVWHLVIPPVMTLLDDYESYYKLKGLIMVSELLKHVPPETLKRTGIDGLLISVRQLAVRCCLPSLKEHQSP